MSDTLAIALGRRFILRKDVKSEQGTDGGWYTKEVPWKMADIHDHLAGKKTYGHYLLDDASNTKLFAFDLDLVKEGFYVSTKEDEIMDGGQRCNPREVIHDPSHPGREFLIMQLRCMAEALAHKIVRITDGEIPVALAWSGGKGMHVYGFLPQPTPGVEARGLALGILNSFNCFEPVRGNNFFRHSMGAYTNIEIEVFPKQDTLEGKRLGNLMALPLGVHRKTGQKKFFMDCRVEYTVLKPLDPMKALEGEMPPWGGTYTDQL